jgi:pilus assembly protein Flp/PilA
MFLWLPDKRESGEANVRRLRPEKWLLGVTQMYGTLLNLYVKFQGLKHGEEGQDLVEYALLVCLVALAAITGVNQVATAINTVFNNISSSLA